MIGKSRFLTYLKCSCWAWYDERYQDLTDGGLGSTLRALEGQEIGRAARSVWAPGQDFSALHFSDAHSCTQTSIQDGPSTVMFEPAFEWGTFRARADMLVPQADGWQLIEVKSSLNDRDELIDDLAYTFMVISGAGVPLSSAQLVLLNRAYRRGLPPQTMFTAIDKTDAVRSRAEEFRAMACDVDQHLQAPTPPLPSLARVCKDCPHFVTHCLGKGLSHSVLELPRLSAKALAAFRATGISEIHQIDDPMILTPAQRVVWEAVKSDRITTRPETLKRLDEVEWPAAYLDFETMATAVPVFDDIAPYEQIPTQYSIHICSAPGVVAGHREYLADPQRDCREVLAHRLIADLETTQSIVVYSGFESRVLSSIADHFPALKAQIQQCIERLFDLEAIIRDGVFAPEFHGSTSIKWTLPALVPGFSYSDMDITNGDDARACFGLMARDHFSTNEVDRHRTALLRYCELDTLAMVKLHRAILSL